jgi:hypothetical protein
LLAEPPRELANLASSRVEFCRWYHRLNGSPALDRFNRFTLPLCFA